MIHFSKIDHKVIIDTLTDSEAQDYIDFLLIERERHKDEIDLCNQTISVLQSGDVESSRASLLLWGSAIKRHSEDIVGIDLLIAKVERKW